MINGCSNAVTSAQRGNKADWEQCKAGDSPFAQKIKTVSNSTDRVLIVGYSPTGGGHTARTLNIVDEALTRGSLSAGSQVFFHVPPHWEGTPRPVLLGKLADKLVSQGVDVRLVESDKPVYGYLDEKTGCSNDPEILKRISLQPLRNKEKIGKNSFLEKYFPQKKPVHINDLRSYTPGDNLDNLPSISASRLIESIINVKGKDNVWVLSDMDPGLQKAALKQNICQERRVDQQNHAILLHRDDHNSNLAMANSVLAKVLDARGAKISHIEPGGKNTLIDAWRTSKSLNIDEHSTLNDRKTIINKIIFSAAHFANENPHNITHGCVFKGQGINHPDDIKKVVYVYAHKKTKIIAEHVLKQLENKHPDYNHVAFIFCGKDALPGYNAMHLAYLVDADGITTAGAGTSGEFAYLHREGNAKSGLLILPIENHNEQEAIANLLQHDFADYILRLGKGEKLEDGKKIDELVRHRYAMSADESKASDQLIKAISASDSYVEQAHDILFGKAGMDKTTIKLQSIQQEMYNNQDMKATRRYLKLYFQLTTYLTAKEIVFPVEIYFKENESPAITFHNSREISDLFNNKSTLMNLIQISTEDKIEQLPLFSQVKKIMTENISSLSIDTVNSLNEMFGHYMTTGF